MKLKKVTLAVLTIALILSFAGCMVEKDNVTGNNNTEVRSFTFTAVLPDGSEKSFELKSDMKTVGEALIKEELISGQKGAYGLYVKTVCGVTLDADKDKQYWAFYVNNDYATSGVDTTEIEEGFKYSFKAEKL